MANDKKKVAPLGAVLSMFPTIAGSLTSIIVDPEKRALKEMQAGRGAGTRAIRAAQEAAGRDIASAQATGQGATRGLGILSAQERSNEAMTRLMTARGITAAREEALATAQLRDNAQRRLQAGLGLGTAVGGGIAGGIALGQARKDQGKGRHGQEEQEQLAAFGGYPGASAGYPGQNVAGVGGALPGPPTGGAVPTAAPVEEAIPAGTAEPLTDGVVSPMESVTAATPVGAGILGESTPGYPPAEVSQFPPGMVTGLPGTEDTRVAPNEVGEGLLASFQERKPFLTEAVSGPDEAVERQQRENLASIAREQVLTSIMESEQVQQARPHVPMTLEEAGQLPGVPESTLPSESIEPLAGIQRAGTLPSERRMATATTEESVGPSQEVKPPSVPTPKQIPGPMGGISTDITGAQSLPEMQDPIVTQAYAEAEEASGKILEAITRQAQALGRNETMAEFPLGTASRQTRAAYGERKTLLESASIDQQAAATEILQLLAAGVIQPPEAYSRIKKLGITNPETLVGWDPVSGQVR